MPFEERFHLREIDRVGICLRKRHVDVVVKDADETCLRRRNPECDRVRGSSGWRFRRRSCDDTNSL